MKKLLILVLLLSVVCTYAQNTKTEEEEETDSIEVKYIDLPNSTPIGAAAGKMVSKEIGSAGGNIISDDGRVELIFPEGALKAGTTISIQPIENLVPNGNGKGYRFEPSGIRFEKPVELIFRYTREDEQSCPALLMFMAIQSDDGKWEYMDYDDWDSTKRVLKGFISHFSQMVNGRLVRLSDEEVTLKVGKKHNFSIFIVNPPEPASADPNEDALPALPKIAPLGDENTQWSVNGVRGGTQKFGVISIGRKKSTARYTAPTLLTNDEYITVGLKTYILVNVEKVTKGTRRKGKMITYTKKAEYLAELSAKVKLYDEYRITVKAVGTSILDCGATLADSSTYEVKLTTRKIEFRNLQNRPPTLTRQANCKPLKYDPAGCLGPVHVNTNLLQGYDPKNYPLEINLEFTPVVVKIMKGTGKFPEEKRDFPDASDDSNVGNHINFKANRQYQQRKYPGQYGFEFIVRPI